MKIPRSNRKKGLIVIDVQPPFINSRNEYIIPNIQKLLENVKYDLYIEAKFYAEENSIWDKQQGWICPKSEENFITLPPLAQILASKSAIQVEKEARSIFKGDKNIDKILKNDAITELHLVGTETNDCVLATAHEAASFGYFAYAIEECCQSSTLEELHEMGVAILCRQNMTNNSVKENIELLEI